MNVTELRSKIYRVIDRVLETGEPCEVVRDGQVVVISPKKRKNHGKNKNKAVHWFEKLKQQGSRKPSIIRCDEETLIYGKLDEWNELKNL